MPASMPQASAAQYSTPHGHLAQQQQPRPPSVPPTAATYSQPPPQPMSQQAPSQQYAPAMGVPTHVSQQKPQGTPTVHEAAPQVAVVDAPRPGAPWWVVAVVGVVCLGLGFVGGFFAHGSPETPPPKTAPHK